MVDLFEINNLLRFYRSQYPEISIEVKYNPETMVINVFMRNTETKTFYCDVHALCFDTEQAKGIIKKALNDALAKGALK